MSTINPEYNTAKTVSKLKTVFSFPNPVKTVWFDFATSAPLIMGRVAFSFFKLASAAKRAAVPSVHRLWLLAGGN